MANKFTKSVLERQAKERKSQTVMQAPKIEEAPVILAPIEESLTIEQMPEPEPVAEIVAPKVPKSKPSSPKTTTDLNLADFIVRDEGRLAKNKTFYLDAAVIDALHKAAVAQKVTDSKLVNDILKKILGV